MLVALAFPALLAGCGGGGTGIDLSAGQSGPDGSRSEEVLRREYADHPEFRGQYGLRQVKAEYAHARGTTGKGVTLGIVDSGVDPDHPRFRGKLETVTVGDHVPDFDSCGQPGPDGACLDLIGHGTYVGGIMASARLPADGAGGSSRGSVSPIHGVAFDADVISVAYRSVDRILEDIVPEDPTPEQIQELPGIIRGIESMLEKEFASAFDSLNGRVTAVNCSFGLSGNIEDFGEAELRARFPGVIRAMAQADTPAGDRTVYVWAAGNSNGEINLDGTLVSATSVDITAGLPVRIPELRGHVLAVVATDRQGSIADFSSRCGIAKKYCLAAPGVDITGPVPGFYCADGSADCHLQLEESGTSAAAPFVTGGIGLLAEHFRGQLGNDGIVRRLLETADRSGAYADSDIYGRGFLDLDAATRPVGEVRMLTGDTLDGPSAPDHASALSAGPAFGDSLARSLAAMEVAAFDGLDAPFFRPLGDYLLAGTPGRIRLGDRLGILGRDLRGETWSTYGAGVRVRFDMEPGVSDDPELPVDGMPASVGSLALVRSFGNGALLLGYRRHPGWGHGLEADNGKPEKGFGMEQSGAFTGGEAFASPWPALARDGASIGYARTATKNPWRIMAFRGAAQYGERRDSDDARASGVLAERLLRQTPESGLVLQAGWLDEDRRLLGSRPGGAFGELGGETVFAGLLAHRLLPSGWRVFVGAHAGRSTAVPVRAGMVEGFSAIWAGSAAIELAGEGIGRAGGRLVFRVAQPLRVESGSARLRWVAGRTPGGRAEVRETLLDLEPSGRQVDFETTWSQPWRDGIVHLAAVAVWDAGHVRGETENALLARYSRTFRGG